MHLIRYQPWGSFDLMDRLLAGHEGRVAQEADWTPAVDVKEEAERFVIHADIPGVDPKDIDISTEDGVLSLSGERKNEARSEEQDWTRTERRSGRFLRRFTLPESTDAENISAHGSHGVLEIVIPKLAKVQPKKITVKAN